MVDCRDGGWSWDECDVDLSDQIALDEGGGVMYVADELRIRRVSLMDGNVTTLAGNGSAAGVDGPVSMATLNAPRGVVRDATCTCQFLLGVGFE